MSTKQIARLVATTHPQLLARIPAGQLTPAAIKTVRAWAKRTGWTPA